MADRLTLLTRARAMRREPTDAERVVWRILRSRRFAALKFRRQFPIGRYIADFACLERKVVIECDGGQHADSAYDADRDAWLTGQGFKVLRVWNSDVLREPEGVEDTLLAALKLA